MRWFVLLLFFSLTASASQILRVKAPSDGQKVVIDYPAVLQKAGLKKARCIFKDSRGFVWIGSENGLYRYDGTNLDYMAHQVNNLETIPNNTIINITEDTHANVWIGTLEGVARIDAYTLKCHVYNKASGSLNTDFDNKVYADENGKIWVGNSTGVYLLNEKKNALQLVWHNIVNGKNGSVYVNALTGWKNDTLVVGTFVDAVLINKKDFHFRRLRMGTGDLTVNRLFVDARKRIWMGTWASGCVVSDTECKHFNILKWEKSGGTKSANIITGIIGTDFDNDQSLWISTFLGIYKVPHYLRAGDEYVVEPVLDAPANNMIADNDRYIWLAGFNVSRFFAGQRFFTPLNVPQNGVIENIQQINAAGHTCLALSSWYGTSGLVIVDGHRVVYRQIKQTNPDDANISGVAIDKFHRLWISSFAGIKLLNSRFRGRPVFPAVTIENDSLATVKTNNIKINHDTVWISYYNRGIGLFDLNFHKLKTFLKNDGSGLKDNLIERIFADSGGNIWLCGNNYLYRYLPSKSKFMAYNLNQENASFGVNDMAELPDHQLLIASVTGLFRFNPISNKSSKIYSPLLAKDGGVQSVSVDARGDVWFITNEHLVYYRIKTQQFTLFGQEDGLNTRNDLDWLRTFDGIHFYLAEYNRIVTFSAGEVNPVTDPIKLYFHAIGINDSVSSSIACSGKQLNLYYKQNRILLEFGAVNFIKPEQNQYAFQLTGVDDQWIFTTRNYASYSNLLPGSYTFIVKAQNASGVWCKPIKLTINIEPPYWETWWFRLLGFISIASLFFIATRYVLQRNLREKILKLEKEQAVEIERNRIARDMHDDLGSGLTKIAILSEVTKAHIGNAQSAASNLDVISTASRELVDNLQDIIWVLNPQNDSVESLVLYIKEYTGRFFELMPVGLQFDHDYETGSNSLSEEKRRNIFMVVKECCNNILKHAGCTAINVNLRVQNGWFIIKIADNGRGFEAGNIPRFSNGLQNMKNRIQQVNGEFQIISARGQGTTIICRVPV